VKNEELSAELQNSSRLTRLAVIIGKVGAIAIMPAAWVAGRVLDEYYDKNKDIGRPVERSTDSAAEHQDKDDV